MNTTTVTEPLRQELERKAAPEDQRTVLDLLERMQPEIAKVLPSHITPERFERVVRTEARRTPKLLECDPHSFLGALLLSAQLGLEPGPLGHVYFVPFKREVEFVIGYRGYVDLAFRSGLVKDVAASLVHEGDEFAFRKGTRPFLDHVPMGPASEREVIAAYAVARLTSGGAPFAVIYEEDWERSRKASAAGSKGLGPWVSDLNAMIRKTAVRRLAPLLPQSPLFARALGADDAPAPTVVEVGDDGPA